MKIDYEYLTRIRRAVALYTNRKTSNILDGDFHSLHRGRSMEFDDLKEYTIGDDVHDIDWKSSSRMGTTLVRRYMTDRRHNVLFVCDRGFKMLGDTGDGESKAELAMMTFGTLAYIFGRNGADYAMAFPGKGTVNISLFKSGTDHLEALLYEYEKNVDSDSESGTDLNEAFTEILNRINKRMIIFLVTDFEGLSELDEGIVRSITRDNDLLIINIEDAYLTGNISYDNEADRYEKLFIARSRKLREEEEAQRNMIISRASEICRHNRVSMMSISGQSEIIDSAVDLLERYRHGYYG